MIVADPVQEPVVEPVVPVEPTGTQEPGSGNTEPPEPKKQTYSAQMKGDLKDNVYFDQFANISEFGTEALTMREQLDRSVVIPGDEATEEERTAYFEKLGRPKEATDYKFDPIDMPKGMKIDPALEEKFKVMSFESGVNQKQASAYYKSFVETGIETFQAATRLNDKRREDVENTLKAEWAEDYKGNVELSRRALAQFAGDDVITLEKEGFGNNPAVMRMLHNIGKSMSEGSFTGGNALNPDAAKLMPDGKTHVLKYKT